MTLINLEAALEQTKNTDKTLLLGNGFSVAQTEGNFSYANLLSKCGLENEAPTRRVFAELDTVDFEEVIKSLEQAALVAIAYNKQDFSERLTTNAQQVREALITAIHEVHPDNFASIPPHEIESCSNFLRKFKEIYTLNYDLLLYWVSLHSGSFSDGFGLGEESQGFRGPFKEEAHCSIYNVHGGLHLFVSRDRNVEKRVAGAENLIEEISSTIRMQKRLPLFVAEGSTVQKLNKIRSVPYLKYCYERLFDIAGALFIFGHSIGDKDRHIYDAIFSSDIKSLYFCVFNPTANLQGIKEQLAPFKERNKKIKVHYVDASNMNIWGKRD